jgi:hypothetical protein
MIEDLERNAEKPATFQEKIAQFQSDLNQPIHIENRAIDERNKRAIAKNPNYIPQLHLPYLTLSGFIDEATLVAFKETPKNERTTKE